MAGFGQRKYREDGKPDFGWKKNPLTGANCLVMNGRGFPHGDSELTLSLSKTERQNTRQRLRQREPESPIL